MLELAVDTLASIDAEPTYVDLFDDTSWRSGTAAPSHVATSPTDSPLEDSLPGRDEAPVG